MLARSLLNHARFSRAKVAAAYSTAPNVLPPAGNAARWALIASGMSAVAAFAFFNKDSSDEQEDQTTTPPLQQQTPSVYQEFLQTQEVASQETLSSTSSLVTGFLQSASGLLQENQMLRLGSGAQDSGWGSGIEVPFSSKHWKKKLERKQADYTRVNSASSERGYKLKTARKKATETLVELREEFGIPGISAAVSYKDDLLWETGIGWADVEQRVPCTPRSKMRIASISKPFTTAALAVLAEQQRIDLDAPIDRYLPGFSPPKILGADNLPVPNQQPITSRMLASHLSGIRHYSSREEFVSNQRYSSILQPLEQLKGQTLLADPGSKYIYSSYGYNVLGAVMAAATGVEFECLLKKLVTDPLKLSETVIDDPTRLVDQRSKQYVRLSPADALLTNRPTDLYGVSLTRCADTQIQPLQLVNAPLVDNTCKIPSGGLLSTPTDLVKFASYFINNTNFLKPETIQMLFTPHYTSTGIPTKYGLGWSIEGSNGDTTPALVKHTGGACGGSSVLILFPEQRLAVSVVANLEDVNLSEAATRIAKHFIADIKGDTKKLVFETQTVRFDDDDLAKKPIKKHKKDKKQEKKKDKKKSKKSKKPKKEKQPKKDKKKDKKKDDKKDKKKKDDKKKDKKKKDDKSGEDVPSDETLPEVVLSEKQIQLLKELEKKQLKKEEKLKKKEAKKLKKAEKKAKKGKKGKKDKKKDKKKKKGKKGKKDKKKDKKKKKD